MLKWSVKMTLPKTLSQDDRHQLEKGEWFSSWLENGPYTFAALNKVLALGDMLDWTSEDIEPELHDLAPKFKMPDFEKLLNPYWNLAGDDGRAIALWKKMTGDWHFKGYWLEKLDDDQCAALAHWIYIDHRRAKCLFKRSAPESVLAVVLEARSSWKRREPPNDNEGWFDDASGESDVSRSKRKRDKSPTRK